MADLKAVDPARPSHIENSFFTPRLGILHGLKARMAGPGGLYNVGNIIALTGGIFIQSIAIDQTNSLNEIIVQYLFGSPEASWLTLAVVLFLISGEVYHRAWVQTGETALRMVRLGDGLSGIAAVVLTFALVQVGEASLGLIGGAMLIVGKLGTAIFPERASASPVAARSTKFLRLLVVASRGPSLAALAITISGVAANGAPWDLAMPGLMVLCYVLWLWADILLLRISATAPDQG